MFAFFILQLRFILSCVCLCCLNMFELLCIIHLLPWFGCLFGYYTSSFRTLFFLNFVFMCFNVIGKKRKPSSILEKATLNGAPTFHMRSRQFGMILHLQEVQIVNLHGFDSARKQGPWVLKFSRRTCNGRRWNKAELTERIRELTEK